MSRRGFALLIVLFLAVGIVGTAHLVWSMVNIDQQIVLNTRKISLAKAAAQSGLNHFVALGLSDADVSDRFVIPETNLSNNTTYEVVATWIDQQALLVVSTGKYKKNGMTLFSYPMRAVFGR